jgi:hypothetical protein
MEDWVRRRSVTESSDGTTHLPDSRRFGSYDAETTTTPKEGTMEETATLADVFDFTFTKFVTPIVIKIAFIVMLVLGALGWLMVVIAGFSSNFGTGLGALIFGGLFFLMFVLVYRIMFELVMVIFAIKKNTDRIES